jgi:hypothetical protein
VLGILIVLVCSEPGLSPALRRSGLSLRDSAWFWVGIDFKGLSVLVSYLESVVREWVCKC